jgi:hypothetical protein
LVISTKNLNICLPKKGVIKRLKWLNSPGKPWCMMPSTMGPQPWMWTFESRMERGPSLESALMVVEYLTKEDHLQPFQAPHTLAIMGPNK